MFLYLFSRHCIQCDDNRIKEMKIKKDCSNRAIIDGNVTSIQNIPDGTTVCNVEKQFGDGGAFIKSAGTDATVFSHEDDGVKLKLASGKFTKIHPKNRKLISETANHTIFVEPSLTRLVGRPAS